MSAWVESEFWFGECVCGREAIGPTGLCADCFIERYEPDADGANSPDSGEIRARGET